MMVLYGILPPAMAWARSSKIDDKDEDKDEQVDGLREGMSSHAVPVVLVGVAIFSCAVVVEQILQDLTCLTST